MERAHTVIVILEANAGKEGELQEMLIKIKEMSRADEKCLESRSHQVENNPCQFIIYETWSSKAAHDEHFAKLDTKSLLKQIIALLANPMQAYFAHELI